MMMRTTPRIILGSLFDFLAFKLGRSIEKVLENIDLGMSCIKTPLSPVSFKDQNKEVKGGRDPLQGLSNGHISNSGLCR
jgi:hypothetical protein